MSGKEVGLTRNELANELANRFTAYQGSNTKTALKMGEVLLSQRNAGISDAAFAEAVRKAGGNAPSPSRMSVYRSAYKVWVSDAAELYESSGGVPFSDEDLYRFSIDGLYHAGRLVGQVDENNEVITHEGALLLADALSDKQLRALVRATNKRNNGGGDAVDAGEVVAQSDSGLRSLTMSVDTYDAIAEFAVRLANAAGVVEVSKSKAVMFALSQVNTLDDGSLDYLWREAHGEVDEEEANEVHTIVLDVEDDA